MHTPTWTPIYPGLTSKEAPLGTVSEISCKIPQSDHRIFLAVATNNALISYVLQHAFRTAVEHITRNNLTYLDTDAFIEYVRKRTITCVDQTSPSSDDAGRVAPVLERASHDKNVSANPGKAAPSGVSGKGTQRGGTGAKGGKQKS